MDLNCGKISTLQSINLSFSSFTTQSRIIVKMCNQIKINKIELYCHCKWSCVVLRMTLETEISRISLLRSKIRLPDFHKN